MEPALWLFCLILARVGMFVALVPLLGGGALPRVVKAGLAVALSMFWFLYAGSIPALPPEGAWWLYGLGLGRELFIGAVLAYGLGLFLVPVHVAAEFIAQEMGLSFGNQVDPTSGISGNPLTQVFELLATALFFAVDGHQVLLGILHGTLVQYPPGNLGMPLTTLPNLVTGASMAEEWGLMLAMPVGVCLFLTTIILTLLNRSVPQLNFHSLGFPLRLGAGLGASLLLLPMWATAVVHGFSHFKDFVLKMM